MYYDIVSDLSGRLRLRTFWGLFDDAQARGVSYALMQIDGVRHAEVHVANGSILVAFEPSIRQEVLDLVSSLDVLNLPSAEVGTEDYCNAIEIASENNRFVMEVVGMVGRRLLRLAFLPYPVSAVVTAFQAVRFVWEGLRRLMHGQLTVEMLDATAITTALLRGAFSEASTVMFLLNLSASMERHVQGRTHLALKDGLVTRPETVWAVVDGRDVQVRMEDVSRGQVLHLGAGSVLPVDGTVVRGQGAIDESSMTGESRLVHKRLGSTVYAGTALQEGDLHVRVVAPPGDARIDEIVSMVEDSSQLKASAQSRAERLADALVPYSFLAFFAILGITRNMTKAMAVLMVDYSCAIKLSTPIAVMSAMNEASKCNVVVKGGKYLEALAAADTVVFDKTGTLTHASPRVQKVLALGDSMDEEAVLRYAACIEEHFPHSMARAIVAEVRCRGLDYQNELHAQVRYVVAHGISTQVDGREAVIGSSHFVFEDEGVQKPKGLDELLSREAPTASVVYLAIDGHLVGAICISDPPAQGGGPGAEGPARPGHSQGGQADGRLADLCRACGRPAGHRHVPRAGAARGQEHLCGAAASGRARGHHGGGRHQRHARSGGGKRQRGHERRQRHRPCRGRRVDARLEPGVSGHHEAAGHGADGAHPRGLPLHSGVQLGAHSAGCSQCHHTEDRRVPAQHLDLHDCRGKRSADPARPEGDEGRASAAGRRGDRWLARRLPGR